MACREIMDMDMDMRVRTKAAVAYLGVVALRRRRRRRAARRVLFRLARADFEGDDAGCELGQLLGAHMCNGKAPRSV